MECQGQDPLLERPLPEVVTFMEQIKAMEEFKPDTKSKAKIGHNKNNKRDPATSRNLERFSSVCSVEREIIPPMHDHKKMQPAGSQAAEDQSKTSGGDTSIDL